MMRAFVAMMPLIDNESIFQAGKISLISAKQPDKIEPVSLGGLVHCVDIET